MNSKLDRSEQHSASSSFQGASTHGTDGASASHRITIHYAFGGTFVTDANGHQTYVGGKRLRVRWIRDTGYQAIYKNLLDTCCKEVHPPPRAISLFYQLPQDGTTFMRNPRPFNSDAHVAELYAAHDMLEVAMEARGVEHTRETRIRMFAIDSSSHPEWVEALSTTSLPPVHSWSGSIVSPCGRGPAPGKISRATADSTRAGEELASLHSRSTSTHSRNPSASDRIDASFKPSLSTPQPNVGSRERASLYSDADASVNDALARRAASTAVPSPGDGRRGLSGALPKASDASMRRGTAATHLSSPDGTSASARQSRLTNDLPDGSDFELNIGHMGFDLLQFKDAHLMGQDDFDESGIPAARQLQDADRPPGDAGHALTNPQRVVRNSSISKKSAFAVTPTTYRRLTGSSIADSRVALSHNGPPLSPPASDDFRGAQRSSSPRELSLNHENALRRSEAGEDGIEEPAAAQPAAAVGGLRGKRPALRLQVASGMQHQWDPDVHPEEAFGGAMSLPDVPASLQVIAGADLTKVRELGRGQFGSVWYAKWRGVSVAVKELHAATTAHNLKEMLQEAETMAVLRHPCIIAFYGVVTDMESPQTVIEYMRDGSLRAKLAQMGEEGSMPSSAKTAIALQAARGMEFLHRSRVVHFDLKCDNLLCDLRDLQNPVVKIGDLGLSKQKAATFVSGNMRGTLPWMAPELFPSADQGAVKDRVTEKVDVFSFGIVLWEIWTLGAQLYAGQTMGGLFAGIMQGSLRPPVPRDCRPDWAALMQRCWASDPRARPSFEEVAAELQNMLDAPRNGKFGA